MFLTRFVVVVVDDDDIYLFILILSFVQGACTRKFSTLIKTQ